MLVEDIGNRYNKDVYFTSSINVPSKSRVSKSTSSSNSRRKRLAPGSYNLSSIESTLHGTQLTEDLLEEKNSLKRFNELDKESYNDNTGRIDLPKLGMNFNYKQTRLPTSLSSSKQLKLNQTASKDTVRIKQSYITSVRKILASKRSLINYSDELDEKNQSILHQIITKKNHNSNSIVTNKKLCSICGDSSPGSCTKCGLRVCSIKCFVVHNETRCTGY